DSVLIIFLRTDLVNTQIYTLSLHDALPILELLNANRENYKIKDLAFFCHGLNGKITLNYSARPNIDLTTSDIHSIGNTNFLSSRSEEHTSELQSRENLVCRLLHEKKKTNPPPSARESTARVQKAQVKIPPAAAICARITGQTESGNESARRREMVDWLYRRALQIS